MKQKLQALFVSTEDWLANSPLPVVNIRFFRSVTYAILLLKILFLWTELPTFYHHVATRWSIEEVSEVLRSPIASHVYKALFLVAGVIVAIAVFVKSRWWLSVLVFLASINYLFIAQHATNNGDTLLHFYVFVLIFINERKLTAISQMIGNAAVWLLKINLCFLYFVNGYGKIIQKAWLDGSFMQQVWQLKYYANEYFVASWFSNPTVCLITAWSVMLFELAFAFLVWFKFHRKWLIPIGIVFHVLIALFLSLPDFGLTMIAAYFLFMDMKHPVKLEKT